MADVRLTRGEMDAAEEHEPRTMRIERVMRSQEATENGTVVITFQADGGLLRLEMSRDHAIDLSAGLASAVRTLEARER
jgi:hypothetical protein